MIHQSQLSIVSSKSFWWKRTIAQRTKVIRQRMTSGKRWWGKVLRPLKIIRLCHSNLLTNSSLQPLNKTGEISRKVSLGLLLNLRLLNLKFRNHLNNSSIQSLPWNNVPQPHPTSRLSNSASHPKSKHQLQKNVRSSEMAFLLTLILS